jgi:hypothetical protein
MPLSFWVYKRQKLARSLLNDNRKFSIQKSVTSIQLISDNDIDQNYEIVQFLDDDVVNPIGVEGQLTMQLKPIGV